MTLLHINIPKCKTSSHSSSELELLNL